MVENNRKEKIRREIRNCFLKKLNIKKVKVNNDLQNLKPKFADEMPS